MSTALYQIDYQKTEQQNFEAIAKEELRKHYGIPNESEITLTYVGQPKPVRGSFFAANKPNVYNTKVVVTFLNQGVSKTVNLFYWRVQLDSIRINEALPFFTRSGSSPALRFGIPKESKVTGLEATVEDSDSVIEAAPDSLLFIGEANILSSPS